MPLARQTLGDDADLRVADLGAPLPYADGAFDVEDWVSVPAELRRVLRPGEARRRRTRGSKGPDRPRLPPARLDA